MNVLPHRSCARRSVPAAVSRTLSEEEIAKFGAELAALRAEVVADLGERDTRHIRAMVRLATYSGAGGRALLHIGVGPLSFAAGVGGLALAKVLENMEIGHNVMHGQYDWTGDPHLDSQTYEWDIACAGDHWRHYHNYEHHTFTNVLGLDRDIGYGAIRVTAEQPWHPGQGPQGSHGQSQEQSAQRESA